jgi:uncharacterized protein YbaR (Trm112 family)
MKKDLINYLICPKWWGHLDGGSSLKTEGDIIESALSCEQCGMKYKKGNSLPFSLKMVPLHLRTGGASALL